MGRDGGIGGGFGCSKGDGTARSLSWSCFNEPSSNGLVGLARLSTEDDDGGESEGGESEGGVALELEEWRCKDGLCDEGPSPINWPSRADRNDTFEVFEELEDLFEPWPLAKSRSAVAAAFAASNVATRPSCEDSGVLLTGMVPSLFPEASRLESGMTVSSPPSPPPPSSIDGRARSFHLTQLIR